MTGGAASEDRADAKADRAGTQGRRAGKARYAAKIQVRGRVENIVDKESAFETWPAPRRHSCSRRDKPPGPGWHLESHR